MTNLYRTHCLTCGTERGYMDHCCPNPTCGGLSCGRLPGPADQLPRCEHITTRQVGAQVGLDHEFRNAVDARIRALETRVRQQAGQQDSEAWKLLGDLAKASQAVVSAYEGEGEEPFDSFSLPDAVCQLKDTLKVASVALERRK